MTPTERYNLLVADMFDYVTARQAANQTGQALIRYFRGKFENLGNAQGSPRARRRGEASTYPVPHPKNPA
jgi:hypothetical protein